MKWLILIVLTQGNPFAIPHKIFDTEDACVQYVSDLSNADEIAIEVISHAGFNVRVESIYCVTNQERKRHETIQKL